MKPLNLDNRPCSPISSNCVIWQGPDIPCIKLCTGDTVSDIVYKLGTELCTIMDQLNVSNYDLSCFDLAACPPSDFKALIQLLIDRICSANGVTTTTSKAVQSTCPDCVVSVAPCFVQGTNPPITTMQLVDYVQMIANRVCSIVSEIANINNQINVLDIRVTALEEAPVPVTPTPIIPITCTIGSLSPGSYAIDTILNQLINNAANGYCALINVLGTPAQIGTSLVPACLFGTDVTTNPNWTATPNTLAQSLTNAWIVLCDLYDLVTSFGLTVADTNTVNLDYTAGVLTANVQDTGWQPLDGFNFYQGSIASSKPQCRRIGNVIHFRGVVFIPLNNNAGTGAETIYDANTYRTIFRATPYVGPGGVIYDSDNRILFNSNGGGAASVIPSSVLPAGQNLDGSYTHSVTLAGRDLQLFANPIGGPQGTAALSAYCTIKLLQNKTLRFTPLDALEKNGQDTISITGVALPRLITSSFIGASYVIDWTSFTIGGRNGSMSTAAVPLYTGSLVIGHQYTINNYNAGDDFTNVGAAANSTGVTFIATGTTPTTWTNNSALTIINSYWAPEVLFNVSSTTGSKWPLITDTTTTGINAGTADNLGGFKFPLDGLIAYISPCDDTIPTPEPCIPS
jgi:hypothetical protein